MQQRRLRPGDVLDDYCPRERRITDHAIVAMIDDNIKQTRCVACDVEHEYKQGRIPPQRRKKTPALFTQVLDGLQGPTRPPHLPDVPDEEPEVMSDAESDRVAVEPSMAAAVEAPSLAAAVSVSPAGTVTSGPGTDYGATNGGSGNGGHANGGPGTALGNTALGNTAASTNGDREHAVIAAPPAGDTHLQDADADAFVPREDGPVRRPLIRATLPRPEGQPVQPTRAMPEFTIRQPNTGRTNRHGGRRRGPHQQQGHQGPMRSGRGANGHRSEGGRGHGHGGGQGRHGGQGGHGGPNGNRGGQRRGGKKR